MVLNLLTFLFVFVSKIKTSTWGWEKIGEQGCWGRLCDESGFHSRAGWWCPNRVIATSLCPGNFLFSRMKAEESEADVSGAVSGCRGGSQEKHPCAGVWWLGPAVWVGMCLPVKILAVKT